MGGPALFQERAVLAQYTWGVHRCAAGLAVHLTHPRGLREVSHGGDIPRE